MPPAAIHAHAHKHSRGRGSAHAAANAFRGFSLAAAVALGLVVALQIGHRLSCTALAATASAQQQQQQQAQQQAAQQQAAQQQQQQHSSLQDLLDPPVPWRHGEARGVSARPVLRVHLVEGAGAALLPASGCSREEQAAQQAELAWQLQRWAPSWVEPVATAAGAELQLPQAACCAHAAALAQQRRQHVYALFLHSAHDCFDASGAPTQHWRASVALWREAVLIMSPAPLEQLVQRADPALLPSLALWSVPWGWGSNASQPAALAAARHATAPPAGGRLVLRADAPVCNLPAAMAAAADPGTQLLVHTAGVDVGQLLRWSELRWLRPFAAFVPDAALAQAPKPPQQSRQAEQQVQQAQAQALKWMAWPQLVPAMWERISDQLQSWRMQGLEEAAAVAGEAPQPWLPLDLRVDQPQAQQQAQHAHIAEQLAVSALAEACIVHSSAVVAWDAARRQPHIIPHRGRTCGACQLPAWLQARSCNASVDIPGLLLISTAERSIGLCTDAALFALHLGGAIVPDCCIARQAQQQRQLQQQQQRQQRQLQQGGAGAVSSSSSSEPCTQQRRLVWLTLEKASPEAVAAWHRLAGAAAPSSAPQHELWFSLNPETLNKDSAVTNALLASSQLLLCKTRDCYHRVGAWLRHTGWRAQQQAQPPWRVAGAQRPRLLFTAHTTPDPWASLVAGGAGSQNVSSTGPDFTRFLHLAGKSGLKHTLELIDAWAHNPWLPPLTVVTSHEGAIRLARTYQDPAASGLGYAMTNLALVTHRLSRAEHDALLASIGMHVALSSKEGFGHYAEQARAAGALLLATDYPPMREWVGEHAQWGLLCPPESIWHEPTELLGEAGPLGHLLPRMDAHFTPRTVVACVRRALALPVARRAAKGAAARRAYLRQLAAFRGSMARLTARLQHSRAGQPDA